ncbi:hypothetical protein D3C86_1329950 [compost metagenome]
MPLMSAPISLVALAERSASLRTSSATTAKPRPASPARAASMAALRARRLVCSAMSSITSTMAPISPERDASSSMVVRMPVMVSAMAVMPDLVSATACSPMAMASFEPAATWLACEALPATCWMLAASSAMAPDVWVTAAASSLDWLWTTETFCSRSWVLTSTALRFAAICSMAAEVTSLAEAWTEAVSASRWLDPTIWPAAEVTAPAVLRTSPTMTCRPSIIRVMAVPRRSRSLLGLTLTLRLPALTSSAAAAISRR